MSASTVPAVKARILALLGARPGLAAVQVTWAAPTEKSDYSARQIFFAETEQDETLTSLGAQCRTEEYQLSLVVRAYEDGDDPQAVEQAAWAVREEVASAIRDDPTLAVASVQYVELVSTRMTVATAAPQGWLAEAACRVRCAAHI